jgi:hypothetical protein
MLSIQRQVQYQVLETAAKSNAELISASQDLADAAENITVSSVAVTRNYGVCVLCLHVAAVSYRYFGVETLALCCLLQCAEITAVSTVNRALTTRVPIPRLAQPTVLSSSCPVLWGTLRRKVACLRVGELASATQSPDTVAAMLVTPVRTAAAVHRGLGSAPAFAANKSRRS